MYNFADILRALDVRLGPESRIIFYRDGSGHVEDGKGKRVFLIERPRIGSDPLDKLASWLCVSAVPSPNATSLPPVPPTPRLPVEVVATAVREAFGPGSHLAIYADGSLSAETFHGSYTTTIPASITRTLDGYTSSKFPTTVSQVSRIEKLEESDEATGVCIDSLNDRITALENDRDYQKKTLSGINDDYYKLQSQIKDSRTNANQKLDALKERCAALEGTFSQIHDAVEFFFSCKPGYGKNPAPNDEPPATPGPCGCDVCKDT